MAVTSTMEPREMSFACVSQSEADYSGTYPENNQEAIGLLEQWNNMARDAPAEGRYKCLSAEYQKLLATLSSGLRTLFGHCIHWLRAAETRDRISLEDHTQIVLAHDCFDILREHSYGEWALWSAYMIERYELDHGDYYHEPKYDYTGFGPIFKRFGWDGDKNVLFWDKHEHGNDVRFTALMSQFKKLPGRDFLETDKRRLRKHQDYHDVLVVEEQKDVETERAPPRPKGKGIRKPAQKNLSKRERDLRQQQAKLLAALQRDAGSTRPGEAADQPVSVAAAE